MPRRAVVIAVVVMAAMFFNWARQSAGQGKQTTEGTEPPVVVTTNPQAFRDDIEPSLGTITATFNQKMMDQTWSWTGGGETFPKITGEPSYDPNKITCSLPVKLEPGKVYWVGINSPSFQNFKNEAGIPAKRFVILFATKDPNGTPTPLPGVLMAKAKAINDS